MGPVFNIDEVFEIARQIERNGAAFYRKAASLAADGPCRKLLQDLAEMEDSHERTFAEMQKQVADAQGDLAPMYDPEDEAVRYLQSFAGGHVFDVTARPTDFLAGKPAMDSILKKAIDLEKDSVVFYLGIRDVMPARLGGSKVDMVIKQEMGHITLLSGQLRALPQSERH